MKHSTSVNKGQAAYKVWNLIESKKNKETGEFEESITTEFYSESELKERIAEMTEKNISYKKGTRIYRVEESIEVSGIRGNFKK